MIRLAPGIPATMRPNPAKNACRAEIPITPRDTARMVAPASWTNSSPRSEASLRENVLMAFDQRGAGEYRKPAMTIAMKNLMAPVPAPAAICKQAAAERLQ